MHLRYSTTVRNGKTYRYAQLVESFRRESDGVPTHRVLASLGERSDIEFENLRAALAAARAGKRVFVQEKAARRSQAEVAVPVFEEALRYLDVATLYELSRTSGLLALLEEVLPRGQSEVPDAHVVDALAIQRCVDPGSKLFATQWYPRSALPELQAIAPAMFNNSRVHRALDALDCATPEIMSRLPRLVGDLDGAFATFFLDATDAWFVGKGPTTAALGKTKEGLLKRKIGIVLLCNQSGFPLRWEVVGGTKNDCKSFIEMLRSVAGLRWVGDTPVVVDRAMGKTENIRQLVATKMQFVTAATVTEFPTYAPGLRVDGFTNIEVSEEKPAREAAAAAALAAGLAQVSANLYVTDLGTIELPGGALPSDERRDAAADDRPEGTRLRDVMKTAQTLLALAGDGLSHRAAGRQLGLDSSVTTKYMRLRHLEPGVAIDVREGQADGLTLEDLRRIAQLPPAEQRRQFDQLLTLPRRRPRRLGVSSTPARNDAPPPPSPHVRVVAFFNPDRFVEKRKSAQKRLDEIAAFVKRTNENLAGGRSRLSRDRLVAAADRFLRKYELVDAFDTSVSTRDVASAARLQLSITLRTEEWARRRRYDGWSVLVAHAAVPHSAADLCRLYRSKDVVEKDFQTIKGLVELRPIRHRTDAKVRAHVSVCMLSLFLERLLATKLKTISADAALTQLETCRLVRYTLAGTTAYGLTTPTADARRIVDTLDLRSLVDQALVNDKMRPR
jgi:hypothetical protein